ncbi:MAG: hypothetical protein QM642_05865 [Edaphocola sp.]
MSNGSTWSRLRWPIKAIIIALPILLIVWFLAKSGTLQNDGTSSSTATQATATTTTTSATGNDATGTSGTALEPRSFGFTPEDPVNGTLKGVVEVGASGFNSFVVNIDNQKRWKVVSKDFGASLVYEGLATTEDIRQGLKKYLASMFDKGVDNKNMHFVISSGAQKEPKTAQITAELKKMGYVVNLVTPEQEGKLALKSAQPPAYQNSSYVVDIGSGNTKVSWYEGAKLQALELPGAKYYEKNMAADAVYNEVKTKVASIPKDKREVCFIIGGIPFEMAKEARQGEERYTVLQAPSFYKSDKEKTKAGVNIYKAIADATQTDTFVFDWDANFTIGFLLSLP